MQKFAINGQTPPKKNSRNLFVRFGKIVNIPSKRYKDWHLDAMWQMKSLNITPYKNQVEIKVTFYFKDKRKRDLSNVLESISDLLVDAGTIPDDNCFDVPSISAEFGGISPDKPRAEVEINEI